ncbi:hypothetical protein FHG87_019123 [Trinorchestia longiramus]|nr:hypothetical protein FHG87_019123 [Trinorchestia longiramus]
MKPTVCLAFFTLMLHTKLHTAKSEAIGDLKSSLHYERIPTLVDAPTSLQNTELKETSVLAAGEEKFAHESSLVTKRQAAAEEGPVELRCGVSCSCHTVNKTIYSDEFRVVCNTTDHQLVLLSSAVFDDEEPPTMNRQVYVRVEDVVGIIVTAGFVGRWTAYTSCAMDLIHVGDIVLPGGPIQKAPTQAYSFVFAGQSSVCVGWSVFEVYARSI